MENKKTYVVIGGLWRDNVNGNTYNAAKIIDTATGERFYTRYTYGYGTAYMQEARTYIREELNQDEANIIDGGHFKVTKAAAKNGQF